MALTEDTVREAFGPLWSNSRLTASELVEKFRAHGDVTSLALALKEDKDINSRIGYNEAAKLLLGES